MFRWIITLTKSILKANHSIAISQLACGNQQSIKCLFVFYDIKLCHHFLCYVTFRYNGDPSTKRGLTREAVCYRGLSVLFVILFLFLRYKAIIKGAITAPTPAKNVHIPLTGVIHALVKFDNCS
jgi:hypothetical protein